MPIIGGTTHLAIAEFAGFLAAEAKRSAEIARIAGILPPEN